MVDCFNSCTASSAAGSTTRTVTDSAESTATTAELSCTVDHNSCSDKHSITAVKHFNSIRHSNETTQSETIVKTHGCGLENTMCGSVKCVTLITVETLYY